MPLPVPTAKLWFPLIVQSVEPSPQKTAKELERVLAKPRSSCHPRLSIGVVLFMGSAHQKARRKF